MMRLAIGGILLMTMACATMPPEDDVPDRSDLGRTCNADRLGDLVGRQATSELGAEAMRRSNAATLRWIRPGDAVTMDYRTDRLNVDLDARGRVVRFHCG